MRAAVRVAGRVVGAPWLEHGRSRPLQVTEVQRGPPRPCGVPKDESWIFRKQQFPE